MFHLGTSYETYPTFCFPLKVKRKILLCIIMRKENCADIFILEYCTEIYVWFSTLSLQTGVPNQRKHIFVSELPQCSWASHSQGMSSGLWLHSHGLKTPIQSRGKARTEKRAVHSPPQTTGLTGLLILHWSHIMKKQGLHWMRIPSIFMGKGEGKAALSSHACNAKVGVFNDSKKKPIN